MLLTITTSHEPATDLGYLLHKNPARVHAFDLSYGRATVFFPEASVERCTAALLVELDPVRLVQGRRNGPRKLDYVNDRPYVVSSHMSVAIAGVFGTALNGSSRERPELAVTSIPLEACLEVVRCRGGETFLRSVFEPLGYEVATERHSAPESQVEYYSIRLTRRCRLQELLEHLYVLIPVLDDQKHYWIGDNEVEKLLRRAGRWLTEHPVREQIIDRYLKHRAVLRREALSRLQDAEDIPDDAADETQVSAREEVLEEPISLNDQRLSAVVRVLRDCGARRVLDLGCGEGRLISLLLKESTVEEVVGVEVSVGAIERAHQRLEVERLTPRQASRLKLLHGSLTYRDHRLQGYDGAAVVEVIEHIEPSRLDTFRSVLLGQTRPHCVVITTPNAEYNVRFPNLTVGEFRHPDHRFEWTRAEFQDWCTSAAELHGYQVGFEPVGPVDAEVGSPTQMAVFTV